MSEDFTRGQRGVDPVNTLADRDRHAPSPVRNVLPHPDGPGLYVVEPLNALPIAVRAWDTRPGQRDCAVRVNYRHRRLGWTRRFAGRATAYDGVLGPDNYIVRPLLAVAHAEEAAALVLTRLDAYRLRGETGRPHEWLGGVTTAGIEAAVFDCLVREGIAYTDVRTSDIATDNTPGTVMGEAEQASAGRTG